VSENENQQSGIAKVVGVGVALLAAFVAQKAIEKVWLAAAGHKPPKADDADESGLAEVAAAAAVTGAVVALARVLATRGAARYTAVPKGADATD
jgi:hypothetical protein